MLARYLLYRLCPEVEVHDDPDMLWTLSELGYATFNTVHRAQLPPGDCDRVIAEVMRRGRLKGVPLLWWIGPLSRPCDLGSRLTALGWRSGEEQPGMAAELELLPVPSPIGGFRFRQVSSVDGLTTWWKLVCKANSRPSGIVTHGARCYTRLSLEPDSAMRCYLGWLGNEPVSTACVVLGAGVAGLYGVATLQDARKQGIGTAMTLKALQLAREMGYRWAVLRASAEGAPLYRRLGFREYGKFSTYLCEGR